MPHNEVQRHTGVVTRRSTSGGPPRAHGVRPPTDPRLGWLLLVTAGIVATIGIAWILGVGSSPRPVTAAVSPSPTAATVPTTVDATRPPTDPGAPTIQTTGATPTDLPSATPEPIPSPTVQPTASPTPTAMPTPAPTASPAPSAAPTPEPELAFGIDFPSDGEALTTREINIIGTAPRGSTITHDVPMWFDEHTVTRDDGIWMMPISLSDGENRLTFRVGDDRATEIVVTVVYSSPG